MVMHVTVSQSGYIRQSGVVCVLSSSGTTASDRQEASMGRPGKRHRWGAGVVHTAEPS